MHDLHRPYAMGPPGKEQRCAHVEDEHSSKEAVACNKLFPRKEIEAGMEEVAEDPRRRDMYRLWMARNCNFLNNFVPLIMLAMLSNMDFQATLSKEAVIEYMAKYMTKFIEHRGEVPTGVHPSHLWSAAAFVQQGVPRPLLASRDAATQNQGDALGGK